jgi:glycosyltransferase involved in cell wall biosynthesis
MKIDVSPKICDIIIPTKNRAQFLNRCISSIYKSNSFRDNLFNVIVSDNNSTDGTDLILNNYFFKSNFYYVKQKEDISGWENLYQLLSISQSKFVLVFSDHVLIEDDDFFEKILASLNYNSDLYFVPAVKNTIEIKSRKAYYKLNLLYQLFISHRFYFISGQIVSRELLCKKIESLKFNAYLFFYFYILNLNNKKNIVRINTFLKFESFSMQNRSWQYGDNGLLLDKLDLINGVNSLLIRYFLIFKLIVESNAVIPHIGLVNYKNTVLKISPKIGIFFYYYFSFLYVFKTRVKLLLNSI